MDCRLAKMKDIYLDARNVLLDFVAIKELFGPKKHQRDELFHQMLTIAYQMMEMILQSGGALSCLPL